MGVMILMAFSLLWGFAEATIFFIIPDVIITFIALSGFKKGVYASLVALVGALIGGSVMYVYADANFETAYHLVESVPGIDATMLSSVEENLEAHGLIAMIFGPLRGIPYKTFAIYATETGIDFTSFFIASIPARFIRFFLTSTLAWFFAQICFKRLPFYIKYSVWLMVWIIVYVIYFSIHPW